jgi:hypothetical protein
MPAALTWVNVRISKPSYPERMWWTFVLIGGGVLLTLYAGWIAHAVTSFRRTNQIIRKMYDRG